MEKMHETIENMMVAEEKMVARVENWMNSIVANILKLNKEVLGIYKDEFEQFMSDIRR